MNSRQRRGVILLVLSVLCALGAFAGVLAVIRDVQTKVGPELTAYRLKDDIAPYKTLTGDQFERVSMPERWLSKNAVTDLAAIRGKIAVTRLKAGSLLQSDMIVDRPALARGQQEIAIMIDAATGVAGKITPGASVNIYATFEGEDDKTPDQSRLIVEKAKVIDVGKLTALDPDGRDRTRRTAEAVPITFALGTADAQRVAYAESFATHVRLALVAPGGGTDAAPGDRRYVLDEELQEPSR
ncbi:Flp pilus assembly protein CpaB [Streptomyces sp. NPDC002454]|jgi:pilus assembly protein CpaB